MIRNRGNAMINIGILDGDYMIVRRQNDADNGDIVVAKSQITVKRKSSVSSVRHHNIAYNPKMITTNQLSPLTLPFSAKLLVCIAIQFIKK